MAKRVRFRRRPLTTSKNKPATTVEHTKPRQQARNLNDRLRNNTGEKTRDTLGRHEAVIERAKRARRPLPWTYASSHSYVRKIQGLRSTRHSSTDNPHMIPVALHMGAMQSLTKLNSTAPTLAVLRHARAPEVVVPGQRSNVFLQAMR